MNCIEKHVAQHGIHSNGECNTRLKITVDNEATLGWFGGKIHRSGSF